MKRLINLVHVKLIFLSYLYAIAVFALFRFFLFMLEIDKLNTGNENAQLITILKAFVMGTRFDLAISGYIMFLPFVILSVLEFINRPNSIIKKIIFYYVVVFFSLAFFVCAADIPYFSQFYSRFSVAAFQWIDSPAFVFRMVILEPRYWLSMIPLIIIIWGFHKLLKKPYFKEEETFKPSIKFLAQKVLAFLLVATLFFTGVRGRIQSKSPIRVGTAYFSENSFLNQLGLNPNFTLMRSTISSKQPKALAIELMDNKNAIKNIQDYFSIENIHPVSPIARKSVNDTLKQMPYNVVVVVMESMSAAKMGRYGDPDNLTPFLDSIAKNGYSFDKTYTSGLHTYNGIYSTFFSYPAIYLQHPMIDVKMLRYNGISNVLKKHDYTTAYFTTHDGQFDNVEGFLTNNDFDLIITEASYPPDVTISGLGVPDDYMLNFSIPILDELNKKGKPFLATYMTASDHGPYYIPEYFSSDQTDEKKQIIEYADWSIKQFIEEASEHSWFDSTIFVFIADHGAAINPVYEMPINYYHTPFIVYAPGKIEPRSFNCIGGQIDVFPTIMGILNLEYTNNTFGIDLINEERPFIYFNGDDKLGVLNEEFLFITKQDGLEGLYKYTAKDQKNYITENKDMADSMRTYLYSNLQAAQYIMNTNMQFID